MLSHPVWCQKSAQRVVVTVQGLVQTATGMAWNMFSKLPGHRGVVVNKMCRNPEEDTQPCRRPAGADGKDGSKLQYAADMAAAEPGGSAVKTYDCPVCRRAQILDLDRLQARTVCRPPVRSDRLPDPSSVQSRRTLPRRLPCRPASATGGCTFMLPPHISLEAS